MEDPPLFLPDPPGRDVPSVAVLVDLDRSPVAGGHVKCWERFAEAAAGLPGRQLGVDLTVYVLGQREGVEILSPNVRFVALRPVISSAPLARMLGGVDAADLAPYHPRLARMLSRHDVWHLTHSFAFANTALRLLPRLRRGPRTGPGLLASVHTDVPALTGAYLGQVADRLPGVRRMITRLPDAWSPESIGTSLALRRRDRMLRCCERVLVATPAERAEMASVIGPDRVSLLGRGVDIGRFRPDPAARADLTHAYGLTPEATLVLFVGRVDASKRVMLLARAIRRLRAEGRPVHLVVAGTGADTVRVRALLGEDVTLLGPVPQGRLARVYAGCDLLAFPSRTETIGNVVAEAMACGLPVVLPTGARTTDWLSEPGRDGLVVAHDDVTGWAAEIGRLLRGTPLHAEMSRAALATSRGQHRSWGQVLGEDLLPLWRRLARLEAADAATGHRAHRTADRGL